MGCLWMMALALCVAFVGLQCNPMLIGFQESFTVTNRSADTLRVSLLGTFDGSATCSPLPLHLWQGAPVFPALRRSEFLLRPGTQRTFVWDGADFRLDRLVIADDAESRVRSLDKDCDGEITIAWRDLPPASPAEVRAATTRRYDLRALVTWLPVLGPLGVLALLATSLWRRIRDARGAPLKPAAADGKMGG
jgi:hypothetical protein